MTEMRAFTMPKWGIEMTEGTVAEWMVAEGDKIQRGQMLLLIETDKITNEVEAEYDAKICRLIAQPGDTLPVGALLAVFAIGAASSDEVNKFIADFRPAAGSAAAETFVSPPQTETATIPAAPSVTNQPKAPVLIDDSIRISQAARSLAESHGLDVSSIAGSGAGGKISLQDVDQALRPITAPIASAPISNQPSTQWEHVFASPLAKRLASTHGIDLASIKGSGAKGRINKTDVLSLVQPAPPVAAPSPAPNPAPMTLADGEYELLPMSSMRKAIARQLTLAKQTIPHFYLRLSAQVDGLVALRQKARAATGEAPSINDYLVRAVALALQQHRDVNIQVHGEAIHRFTHSDIAIAVSSPKGLVTPIVRAAETKSVAAISREIRELADRARAGRLAAEEIRGGNFSISNLGMYGIEQFDAIINPPQGAILAVGAAVRRPAEANHSLGFPTLMSLSLSCDHRAIDGALGAQFMQTLRELIEQPEQLTA